MAKETYLGSNVGTQDTFAGWIDKTNQVRDDMGNIVVTVTKLAGVEPDANNAGLTTGNAAIDGVLTVDTMAVSSVLRGGNVMTPGNLVVTSNAHFTQSANVWISANTSRFDVDANNMVISSNVTFDGGATKSISVNVANTTITNGSLYVMSNTEFSGASANVITTSLNVTANSTFSGSTVNITSTNTTIGDAGSDALNVNAATDFNANVNIDGITTHTANVHITDGDYLLIGTGNDLQIYHDGSDSYVRDAGAGNLYLQGDASVRIRSSDGTLTSALFTPSGPARLSYAGAATLETTSTGTDVFGEIALKTNGTNQIVGESTTTAYQQLDFKLRTSAQNERTPLILTTSNTVIAGANSAYDLGSTATNWRHVYAKDTTTANSAVISNTLTVNTQANTASMMVRDLTATRIVYAGTGGELIDNNNLTFSGSNLNVIGTANVTSNANVGGSFGVTGATTLASTLAVTGAITAANTFAVTGNATFSANVDLGDNQYLNLGASDDLQIFHDGTNSFIRDTGTGDLFIRASNTLYLQSHVGAENYLTAVTNADVTLYYDNAAKLATKTDGILVTGEVESSSLDVNGAADISGNTAIGGALSVSGDTTLSANLNLSDSKYLNIGTGQDLRIYHNGLNSYVDDVGIGDLYFRSANGSINIQTNTDENSIVANQNGAVTLYYDSAAKLATKTDGVTITGELESTSLDVANNASIGGGLTIGGDLNIDGNFTLPSNSQLSVNSSVVEYSTIEQELVLGTLGGSFGDATVTGDIIPTLDSTYDIGSDLVRYAYIYADAFNGNGAALTNLNATNIASGTLNKARLPASIDASTTGNAATATLAATATNATNINVAADDTTNASHYLIFTGGATGDQKPNSDTALSYNPSTNVLTAGTFNGNIAWANVTSKPDPVVTVTLTGDITGSGNATLTDLGNGTITLTTTYNNDVVLGTDTSGNYAAAIAAGAGISLIGVAGEGTAYTVAHADTSSVSNINIDNSGGTVLQDLVLTYDTFGHTIAATAAAVNLDTRYSQNTFSMVAVSGQANVVADSITDTLTLAAGGIVSINTDAVTDTITIAANEVDTLDSVTSRGNTTTNDIIVNDVSARNLVLSGNLTVSGTTTTVNTEEINIADNIIVLNSNYSGSTPSENGGIEIERGTLQNKSLYWDETNDRWTVGAETFVADTFIGNLDWSNVINKPPVDNYSSWTIRDGDTTTYAINSGDTLQIKEGTGIDVNFTAARELTISTVASGIDHDALNNFVSNEHIDHASVSINAGDGLSGGGNIAATRTLSVDGTVVRSSGDRTLLGQTLLKTTSNGSVPLIVHSSFDDPNNIPTMIIAGDGEGSDILLALRANAAGDSANTSAVTSTLDDKVIIYADGDINTVGTITAAGFTGDITGNASTASSLETASSIILGGDLSGSASFDGSANVTITATVSNDSHTHDGRYYTEIEADSRFLATASPNIFTGSYTRFNDSSELRFGTGSDVDMYYGGSNFVTNIASGAWNLNFVTGQNLNVQNNGTTTLLLNPAAGEVRADKFSFYSQSTSRFDYEANTAGISGAQTVNGNILLKLGTSTDFIITKHDSNGDYMWYSRSNGNVQISGNFISASDERLKENIVPIEGALEKVTNLNGVYYNRIGKDKREVGLIAQNVETQIPELVYSDGDGMKAVDYPSTVAVLIEAIKELKAEIDALKGEK